MIWQTIKRWRWALAIGGLLLLAIGYAFWPETRAVDIGKVGKGPMAVGITDDGVTREDELYVVSAPVTGFASRITLEAGDRIEKGQVIARMTGRPAPPLDRRTQEELRSALAAAQAAESSTAASLVQARRDLARAEELAPSGVTSRADLEAARTRVSTGQASLAQNRAEVRRIEASLAASGRAAGGAPIPVVAPASGMVLLVQGKSEGVITEGTPLVTLGDPERIEIVVDLLSREAVRVKPGDRVEITQWGGDTPLVGHVKYVEPYGRLKVSALGIEEQRVNVVIGFDPASARDAARLGHGYQVDATIIVWSKADALRVPVGALFRGKDGTWHAFAVEGGRVHDRPVKIGHVNDDYGEVLGGLPEGASVVLNPANDILDGERVKAR
ncbi:efflux RND transporter periplasmic adaptor subunit [Novosphingobium mangrovi (ex Huang et al. 2023)]|uniref:Efflux RND transporter periplasmic adaptor subunit n=1 Tax=Novosphingobium mangrovi (ex Huang et al. 2023) TaxID=2976432 RepID=A0ABT2I978_9SPHN|nr:efflux RND transporter periplasmic adaptor subunit [Novosphingobium mangrovi (ex Huang et al. 2023)]MCT2401385.1 efflux RND transporter periplasmic adaptor subunit [Novosphingobium mangrovi (ex Huang et al. 2023)]